MQSQTAPTSGIERTDAPENGLTAIIVCYGAAAHLARSLQAIAGAGGADRILLVDNNPPEARVRIEASAVEVLVAGGNLGYGRAINLALTAVRGGRVLIVNPDLALEPGALERLSAALDAHPRAAAAGPRLLDSLGNGVALSEHPPTLQEDLLRLAGLLRASGVSGAGPSGKSPSGESASGTVPGETCREVGFLSGSCLLARVGALREIGGFDPRFFLYYEDADLALRLRAAGWSLLFVPEATASHSHGASWRDPVLRQATSFRGALVYHRKHGGAPASFAYRSGLALLYFPRMLLAALALFATRRRDALPPARRLALAAETLRIALGPCRAEPGRERHAAPDPRGVRP